MTYDHSATIGQFLDAAAAKRPTPGGGAVTALAGALAAAMGEMVVNYSVGKKGLEEFQGELQPALRELNTARQLLLRLMAEDQAAYQALAEARRLPEGSPERTKQFPEALRASIAAPQAMAATGVAILGVCERIINFVNYHLLSDLAVAADLAMATTRCAIYSVRVNLPDVPDPGERQEIESTVGQVLIHAAMLIQQVAPRIWSRHGEGP